MCSYCGCDSIEVIGRFMAEHVEIINATGKLRAAVHAGQAEAVETGRAVVAGLLWPHTVAEETGLFTVMARDAVYADHIAALCDEHKTLETLLGELTPGGVEAMAGSRMRSAPTSTRRTTGCSRPRRSRWPARTGLRSTPSHRTPTMAASPMCIPGRVDSRCREHESR